MAAEEKGEDPKQVQQEGDHQGGIVAGSEPTDQLLARRLRFWRRTGYQGFLAKPMDPFQVAEEILRLVTGRS